MVQKARKQGSNYKGKCNSSIFSTRITTKVLNIGLLHFPLLFDPCSLLFTPLLPSNPIYHQLSHRMFVVTCFMEFCSYDCQAKDI